MAIAPTADFDTIFRHGKAIAPLGGPIHRMVGRRDAVASAIRDRFA